MPRATLSIHLNNFAPKDPGPGGWRRVLDRARAADFAGIDRVAVSEHVILGENLEAYGDPTLGGSAGGRQPTGSDGHWLDPLTVLSMVAAVTERVRLSTGILIAALRRPATLAKQLASLDVLSGGRLDIGVGVGWQREEYQANGIPFEHRGQRLNATLDICQKLWSTESASYTAPEVNFERVHCNPKPLQPGGVPFWISGTLNENVLRRIERYGSGWIPWGPDARDPVAGLRVIRERLQAAGRDPSGFEVTTHLPAATHADGAIDVAGTVSTVPALIEAGITDFQVPLPLPDEEQPAAERMAKLVAGFREASGRTQPNF